MSQPSPFDVVTVTLNPAIDRTVVIPNFAAGEVNRVESFRDEAGGKGVNVATALALSGARVAATGLLGSANDMLFRDHFKRHRIQDSFVRIPAETRTGIKVTDPKRAETTDINFPGAVANGRQLCEVERTMKRLLQPQTWCVLAGSLPPGPDADIYGRWIGGLNRYGRPSLLDTSGKALQLGLDAGPTIVKPNVAELEGLIGQKLRARSAILRAASSLLNSKTKLVVVSMGGDGALFISARESLLAKPPRVKVITTVGAGDAMVAGILFGQLKKSSLAHLAKTATAFSLDTITRVERGISLKRVETWSKKVSVLSVAV